MKYRNRVQFNGMNERVFICDDGRELTAHDLQDMTGLNLETCRGRLIKAKKYEDLFIGRKSGAKKVLMDSNPLDNDEMFRLMFAKI